MKTNKQSNELFNKYVCRITWIVARTLIKNNPVTERTEDQTASAFIVSKRENSFIII